MSDKGDTEEFLRDALDEASRYAVAMHQARDVIEADHAKIIRLIAAVEDAHRLVEQMRQAANGFRDERDAALATVRLLQCPFAGVIGPLEHEQNGCCA